MRMRKKPYAEAELHGWPYFIQEPAVFAGRWQEYAHITQHGHAPATQAAMYQIRVASPNQGSRLSKTLIVPAPPWPAPGW